MSLNIIYADDQSADSLLTEGDTAGQTVQTEGSADTVSGTPSDTDTTDTDDPDKDPPEPEYDITAQVITGFGFNEKSRILSWDPVDAPESKTIEYHVYLKGDNIKSEDYKRFSGQKGWMLTTKSTSVNIDDNNTISETIYNFESADYTFYVKATDGSKDSENVLRFSKEAEDGTYSMSYYPLEVFAYTKTNIYNSRTKKFVQSTRQYSRSQGGEILMDGESLNKLKEGNGEVFYSYNEKKGVKEGATVTLKYEPLKEYRLYSEKIDSGDENRSPASTRRLTMDKAHKVTAYFELPMTDVIIKGIEAKSGNFAEAGAAQLLSDAVSSGAKSNTEGYIRMRVAAVGTDSLSDAEKNVCKNDSGLKAKNVNAGTFFNVSFYESLGLTKTDQINTFSDPVDLTVTIPDSMKATSSTVNRTYYLIRVNNGDATILSTGKGDTISGSITNAGLYMIGYKDSEMEGKLSGGGSKSKSNSSSSSDQYTFVEAEPQPEPEPVPVAQGSETDVDTDTGSQTVITGSEQEPAEDEKGFPIGAVAAGAGAVGGGAYGIRRLLLALGRRRRH